MKKILIASTNKEVIGTVKPICQKYATFFDPMFCPDTDEALNLIDYEIPEIKVLDFTSDDIDCEKILTTIDADPWLHNGGIIAVVKTNKAVQEMEERKNLNILAVQTLPSFKENFERLLKILYSNKNFLFNRGMQESLGGIETGSFVCGNDPFDLKTFAGFLVNYLYSTNRIGDEGRYALQTTFMELLTNAMEHGNCNISYDEKTKLLESGGSVFELIREKNKDPAIAAKKIHIEYTIGKERSFFSIRDEGEGFDWRSKMKVELDFTTEMHGRGIAMSKSLIENMQYNEKGNQVSFEIENLHNESNNIPLLVSTLATIKYEKHQIVCRQNEPSTDLFFIVSGRYGVYVDNKLISVLTPNDIFIGEMAFLLDDRRSATIMSAGEGQLIRIPKVTFLNLIRKNPHYGIFLSKLLAQRVSNQNRRTIELSAELAELKKEIEE